MGPYCIKSKRPSIQLIMLLLFRAAAENQSLSPEEFYQLLTQATRYMREEYIEKMNKANNEINKR